MKANNQDFNLSARRLAGDVPAFLWVECVSLERGIDPDVNNCQLV